MKEPSISDNSSDASESEESQRQHPSMKTKQSSSTESNGRTSSGGVRAWQTKKRRKAPSVHTERQRRDIQEGTKGAKEVTQTPKYDLLDSPPEKLRSGVILNSRHITVLIRKPQFQAKLQHD